MAPVLRSHMDANDSAVVELLCLELADLCPAQLTAAWLRAEITRAVEDLHGSVGAGSLPEMAARLTLTRVRARVADPRRPADPTSV